MRRIFLIISCLLPLYCSAGTVQNPQYTFTYDDEQWYLAKHQGGRLMLTCQRRECGDYVTLEIESRFIPELKEKDEPITIKLLSTLFKEHLGFHGGQVRSTVSLEKKSYGELKGAQGIFKADYPDGESRQSLSFATRHKGVEILVIFTAFEGDYLSYTYLLGQVFNNLKFTARQ